MDYHITLRCYGTWLHGDERGSVDCTHNVPGTDLLEPHSGRRCSAASRMKSRACTFDERSRGVVEAAIREVIEYRNWGLYALAVRTNHVHIVVCAEVPPSILLHDFKSRATRLLREAGLASENERIWARHGSTRYLHTPDDIRHAIEYAMEGQGGDLSGV